MSKLKKISATFLVFALVFTINSSTVAEASENENPQLNRLDNIEDIESKEESEINIESHKNQSKNGMEQNTAENELESNSEEENSEEENSAEENSAEENKIESEQNIIEEQENVDSSTLEEDNEIVNHLNEDLASKDKEENNNSFIVYDEKNRANRADVSTPEQFVTAYNSSDVAIINLLDNIRVNANQLKTTNVGSKTINGNSYGILNTATQMGGGLKPLFEITGGTATIALNNFRLDNLRGSNESIIKATSSSVVVALSNVFHEASNAAIADKPLIVGDGVKTIRVIGGVSWTSPTSVIDAPNANLEIKTANAVNLTSESGTTVNVGGVDITNSGSIEITNTKSGGIGNAISVSKPSSSVMITNSNLKITQNLEGSAISVGTPYSGTKSKLTINNSKLNITSRSKNTSSNYAAISIRGRNSYTSSEDFGLEVLAGGELILEKETIGINIDVKGQGTMDIHGVGSKVKVGNLSGSSSRQSHILMDDSTNDPNSISLMRVFNRAKLDLKSNIGFRNAISFQTQNPKLDITSAGEVDINNGRIMFFYKGNKAKINLDGLNSSLKVDNPSDSAIFSEDNLDINIGQDSNIFLKGNTTNTNSSLIKAQKMKLYAYQPKSYTFETTGNRSQLFSVSPESSFQIVLSDLLIWKDSIANGVSPDNSWYNFSTELKGAIFNQIQTSSENTFKEQFSKLYGITGISNAKKISNENSKIKTVKLLPNPYDTDRYIYGYVDVFDGLGKTRRAFKDEVHLKIEETDVNGKKIVHNDVPTHTKSSTSDNYEVYKDQLEHYINTDGLFRIDLGQGNLAKKGSTYKVLSAYKGTAGFSEGTKKYLPGLQLPNSVKVGDKTPPPIAQFERDIYVDETEIRGTTKESSVKVYLAIDGTIKKNINSKVVGNNWTINLKEQNINLLKDQKVQIILEDENGNSNGLKASTYHDASFPAASSKIVQQKLYDISAEDLYIGKKQFNNIKNDIDLIKAMKATIIKLNPQSLDGKIVVSNRDGLNYVNPRAGTYNIEFSVENHGNISVKRKLVIMNEDFVVNGKNYIITGKDFYIGVSGKDKNLSEIAEIAQVRAYSKSNLQTPVEIDWGGNTLKPVEGSYNVVFFVRSETGTKVSVTGDVIARDNVSFNDDYVVGANDFELNAYLANDLKDEDILKYSKAIAWNRNGWKKVDTKVLSHNIEAEENIYRATITVE